MRARVLKRHYMKNNCSNMYTLMLTLPLAVASTTCSWVAFYCIKWFETIRKCRTRAAMCIPSCLHYRLQLLLLVALVSFYGNHCWYINIEQLLLCGVLMCLFYHHYCCHHHKRAGEHHAAREYSGQIQKPQPLTRTCSRHPRSTNNIRPYLLLDNHRVWQWHFHDCDTW